MVKIKDLVAGTNQDLDRIINNNFKEVDLEGNLNLEVVFKIHQEACLEDNNKISFQVSKIIINKMLIKWIAVMQKFPINLEIQFLKYALCNVKETKNMQLLAVGTAKFKSIKFSKR